MNRVLVTGANGHVGNNLVRELARQGYDVKAGLRSLEKKNTLKGVQCEIVHCDLMDKGSLKNALADVDILFQVAAVFKHWAEDEEREIVQPNVIGTRNVLKAAHEMGVQKIVYVSSIVALEQTIRNEKGEVLNSTYNESDQGNPYCRAKTLAEQEAWKVAKELNLNLVTVLPSTILGGEYQPETESLNSFNAIVNGRMPFLYNMYLSIIDVRDVVSGIIAAAISGKSGSRYVLSNTEVASVDDVIAIAREINPGLVPPKILTEEEIYDLADKAEAEAKLTNSRPVILRSNVKRTLNQKFIFDLENSVADLEHAPTPIAAVLRETFANLYAKE